MRINQYISASGHCSRREADELLLKKRVRMNGKVAQVGDLVPEKARVEVDGKLIKPKAAHVYLILNKPVGITCTTERHVKGNVIDFIHHKERIFPVGRLDKDSEGLLLLTSDGNIVNDILRAENAHDKEYLVKVNKPIDAEFVQKMENGIVIYNPVTKKHVKTNPCSVQKTNQNQFKIILSQGLNRQIRRMCEATGYEVVELKRTRIMHIALGNLKSGQWRDLTSKELSELKQRLSKSTLF